MDQALEQACVVISSGRCISRNTTRAEKEGHADKVVPVFPCVFPCEVTTHVRLYLGFPSLGFPRRENHTTQARGIDYLYQNWYCIA